MKKFWRIFKWVVFAHLVVGVLLVAFGLYTMRYQPRTLFNDAIDEQPYDVIIVPGVPYENNHWSWIMKARVHWSKYLFEQGVTKNIIYSGSSVYSPYKEGEVMRLYAIELGLPATHVFAEVDAEHSTENLYYSYYMAKDLGFEKIALATDPFQSKMLVRFNRKRGFEVTHIPIVFDKIEPLPADIDDPKIDATTAYVEPWTSIKEREGFWKRFQGTLGDNIKEH